MTAISLPNLKIKQASPAKFVDKIVSNINASKLDTVIQVTEPEILMPIT